MTKDEKLRARLGEITVFERPLWNSGLRFIAGADEAGRGPLAGPVVAACVIMPPLPLIEGIDDSKKLTARRREEMYSRIMETAVDTGIGVVSEEEIDRINILEAACLAFQIALASLHQQPDFLFTDAMPLETDIPMQAMTKADQRVYNVAAASIVAKVTRDRMMDEYAGLYPEYGFERHKGYGTPEHRAAILRCGVLPVHRRTFLRKLLGESAV